MECKFCGERLPDPQPGGHRQRLYCNDAHRQAFFRQKHQADQHAALLAELETLRAEHAAFRAETVELRERNEELESEVSRLRHRIDLEQQVLSDTEARFFKSWLKKQRTVGNPLVQKLQAIPDLPDHRSRAFYRAKMRSLNFTPDELHEFDDLWKRLILDRG